MCDSHWQLRLLWDILVEYQLFSAMLFAQWAKQKSRWNKPQTSLSSPGGPDGREPLLYC